MYKSIALGVMGYRNRETNHTTLLQAQKYLLRTLREHQPGWIYRISDGKEVKLPGQYEVHKMPGTGFRPSLYRRLDKPNRLSRSPILVGT